MNSSSHTARTPIFRLLAVGVVGGTFCGLFGVGGGIVMVPLLMWWARFDPKLANATSLLAIAPMSAVGASSFAAGGLFPWLPAILVAIGAVPGAELGALILTKIDSKLLRFGFSVFALLAGFSFFLAPDNRGTSLELSTFIVGYLIAIGFLMGLFAGIFGVGGGVVVIPALVLLSGVGDIFAKSVSLLAMIPGALGGGLAHLRHRSTSLALAAWVGLGAIITVPAGTYLAFTINASLSNALFGMIMLFVAIGVLFVHDKSKP